MDDINSQDDKPSLPEPIKAKINEILNKVPPQERSAVELSIQQVISTTFHNGIIPPADEMSALERIQKGTLDRFLTIAEREQDHRHKNESRIVIGELMLKHLGQGFALVALFSMLGIVGYMAHLGQSEIAAAFGVAIIIAVVFMFIKGREINSEDLRNMRELQNEQQEKQPQNKAAKRRRR